ncbi:electron transport complex subunit RsxE [Yersinia enterocolitica]
MSEAKDLLAQGLWKNNSALVQLLGLCPLLAVSSTATNALGLGLATTLVLVCTNTAVSALRRWVPNEIRIPIYVMIIASVVSTVQMLINAYAFGLYQSLGIFIPLIVTNCIVIGRAEAYAARNPVGLSALDGLAMGLGATCALFVLGSLREILGNGTLFDGADMLLGDWAKVLRIEVLHLDSPFLLAMLPPGAFIGLGLLLAGKYVIDEKMKARKARAFALVFKDRPDYRFLLGEKGEVLDIIVEHRRIANRIVEECMIAANVCAAIALRDNLGFGIYNVHTGFDPALVEQAANVLQANGVEADPQALLTLPGFCELRRHLDALPTQFLDSRIRRFQTFAEISTVPGPHFGLGLEAYATWTSPIRKYGDMVNHRLLKAIITGQQAEKPQDEITVQLAERRRLNRMAERDVGDWLYARYLQPMAGTDTRFPAEIIDVTRGGLRVRLLDNGAVAFIPAPFIHAVRDEMVCSQETGTVQIKGETVYSQSDKIEVRIAEVRMETRNVVARPVV